MSDRKTYPFILELAKLPITIDNILATHTIDGRGKCEGCHLDEKLRKSWPCALWTFAEAARDLRAAAEQLRTKLAG